MNSSTHDPFAVSRRQFLAASAYVAATAAWLGVPRELLAAEGGVVEQFRTGGAKAVITAEKLRGNITMLIGSGGNIGVLNGADGKVIVDAGLATSKTQIEKALADIGKEPLRHVVNTHWHFDHTDGNEWMHAAGASIVAHENTRKRMSEPTRVEAWNFTFPPAPAGALPGIAVKDRLTLHLNGQTVEIEHYPPPCHTNTDLVVRFVEADVFHTGDTFWNGHYPFIDYSTGGSIDGMIKACELNLARVGDKTQIIPGHGPVATKADLQTFRDVLAGAREKIAAMKKAGKSLKEVIASKPTAAHDAKWGDMVINPATFAALVYAGV